MMNSIHRKLRQSEKTYNILRKSGKRCDWTLLPKDIKILLFDKYVHNLDDFAALKMTCVSFFKASQQSSTGLFLHTFDFHQHIKIF